MSGRYNVIILAGGKGGPLSEATGVDDATWASTTATSRRSWRRSSRSRSPTLSRGCVDTPTTPPDIAFI